VSSSDLGRVPDLPAIPVGGGEPGREQPGVIPGLPWDSGGQVSRPPPPKPRRVWLHVLLLVLTFLTTSAVGASLVNSFEHNRPVNIEENFYALALIVLEPTFLLRGLIFSVPLLVILLAHECGHYFACRYYGIDATLPFFLPAPTPLVGTFGAFIRIKAPIYSKKELFDVGVAGPLAGFAVLLPVLLLGVAWSKVIRNAALDGDIVFGTPLVLRAAEALIFPGVSPADIYLHPMARAAWVGVLATALNLLPIGQLDGGHILYAFFGEWHRPLSRLFIAALIPIGFFFSYNWLLWAVVLFFFGMRHPMIFDSAALNPTRRWLGALALIILLVSFTLAPVRSNPA
jgi:hypothetical protein